MHTEMIDFPSNGSTAPGYLAHDETTDAHPGLVVLQEWWGLDDHIRDVTRRFADVGYIALAPDLYHGVVTTEPDDARKQLMALDMPNALREIAGAVAYLKNHARVSPKRIGVVGFCMGGALTLHAAANIADVGAGVAFYGGRPPEASEFAGRDDVAVLNLVGDKDVNVLEKIRELEAGLAAHKLTHELVVYPDAEHAFFNDTRDAYKADAAADAWGRTLKWFAAHLTA